MKHVNMTFFLPHCINVVVFFVIVASSRTNVFLPAGPLKIQTMYPQQSNHFHVHLCKVILLFQNVKKKIDILLPMEEAFSILNALFFLDLQRPRRLRIYIPLAVVMFEYRLVLFYIFSVFLCTVTSISQSFK